MRRLGFKAYRFSTAWPRIMPEGTGTVNEKGLDFYDRLVDALLEADIVPYITLFHWDYPYGLYRRGGWLNPDSPRWFGDYVSVTVKRLGDRVRHFITLNEPQIFVGLGHDDGSHAPGLRLPVWDTLSIVHNVLLAHGRAVQAIRAAAPDALVGYAPCGTVAYPATENPKDREAARAAYFALKEKLFFSVSLWSDPVFLGKYPAELYERYGEWVPNPKPEDMAIISQRLDFLGQNIYQGFPVRSGDGSERVPFPDGYAITALKWPITPEALYWGPVFLWERYRTPLYITENGLSCADTVFLDGKVHDPARIDFLARYLRCLKKASTGGADIRGYFQWSVTDNFEWARGYTERFGLVFCDYETQERIIKDSGFWYRDVIASNGENL
jgi:beta-glucosidase